MILNSLFLISSRCYIRDLYDGIARVLFTIDGNVMMLLHGFIKKTQKIPKNELKTALSRLKKYQED